MSQLLILTIQITQIIRLELQFVCNHIRLSIIVHTDAAIAVSETSGDVFVRDGLMIDSNTVSF